MKRQEDHKRRYFPERLIDAVILLSFILALALIAFQYISPGMISLSPAVNPYRILQPQSVTEEVIPEYTGVRRTYQFDMSKIPGNKGRGRTFFVYLRHTAAVLKMDG